MVTKVEAVMNDGSSWLAMCLEVKLYLSENEVVSRERGCLLDNDRGGHVSVTELLSIQ